MRFRSLIRFRVKAGRGPDFEAAFERAGMLTRPRAIPGFGRAELIRSLDDPCDYAVVGEWQSEEAYRQWQSVSAAEANRDALAALGDTLEASQPGRLFVVGADSLAHSEFD